MKGIGSIDNWAVKPSVMEFYRRELSAGRMPIIAEKGKMVEMATAVISEGDALSIDAAAMEVKSGTVAIVCITGVMTRYGELCSYGTEDIAQTLKELDQNPAVSGVVLKWDTPGGEVNGMKVFGEVIHTMSKPKVSYVIQADSGGYWGASQTDEIILEDNAQSEVGSIGVLCIRQDVQGMLEKQGIKIEIMRADGSVDKARMNPYEDAPVEAIVQEKNTLNDILGEFIDVVKNARPNIDASVFSGKTYRAKQALKLGLVDRVGSLQDAVNRVDFLARKKMRAENVNGSNNSNNNKSESMGWLSGFLSNEKVTDEKAAEAAVDNKVGEMTEQISTLMTERDAEKTKATDLGAKVTELEAKVAELTPKAAKVAELETKVAELEGKVKVLEPKANQFDSISAEHETNKTFVANLKEAGINPAMGKADANTKGEGPAKRSYEAAPWNAKAVEMSEKLNG
jgi:protease IV